MSGDPVALVEYLALGDLGAGGEGQVQALQLQIGVGDVLQQQGLVEVLQVVLRAAAAQQFAGLRQLGQGIFGAAELVAAGASRPRLAMRL